MVKNIHYQPATPAYTLKSLLLHEEKAKAPINLTLKDLASPPRSVQQGFLPKSLNPLTPEQSKSISISSRNADIASRNSSVEKKYDADVSVKEKTLSDKQSNEWNTLLYHLVKFEELKRLPVSIQDVIIRQAYIKVLSAKGYWKSSYADKRDSLHESRSESRTSPRSAIEDMSLKAIFSDIHWKKHDAVTHDQERNANAHQSTSGEALSAFKPDFAVPVSHMHPKEEPFESRDTLLQALNLLKHLKQFVDNRLTQKRTGAASVKPCIGDRRRGFNIKGEIDETWHRKRALQSSLKKDEFQREEPSNDVLGYGCGPIRYQQSMPTGPPKETTCS